MSDVEPKQEPTEPDSAIADPIAEEEVQAEGKESAEASAETKTDDAEAAIEEGEEGEEAKADDAEEKGEQQAQEEKRKRAGGWQRKIERLERQNAQLTEQLGRNAQPPAGKADKDKTPEEQAHEYVRGLVRQEREQWEAERAQQTRVAEFQRRTAEVRAVHPDFAEVIDAVADVPVSKALEEVLLTSEHGPSIMYQLASNPAELARLSALPPLDAAREIGRLEAKQASSTPPPKTTKPALRPPVPPTSVNGSASSTRDLMSLPLAAYKLAMRRSGRS